MTDTRPKIIVLIGPTAVGKTAVSIPLARSLNAEIISADSRQVYIGLDIGTAKPSPSERGGVAHHILDVVDPRTDFTVADFQRLAFEAIEEILKKGKMVLITGGTGLYIRALIDRPAYQDQPPIPRLRREILEEIVDRGNQAVYDELQRIDPSAAEKIHPNNIPRLVRAMEVIRATGRPFSEGVERDRESKDESPFQWILVGLNTDRERLYERINQRAVRMIHSGWIDEVRRVLDSGCCGDEKPLTGLGYRDIISHIRGEKSLDAALELVRRDTRRFAKRQMTYFRRLEGVHWIDVPAGSNPAELAESIRGIVSEIG